jgi:hypothetical protein
MWRYAPEGFVKSQANKPKLDSLKENTVTGTYELFLSNTFYVSACMFVVPVVHCMHA